MKRQRVYYRYKSIPICATGAKECIKQGYASPSFHNRTIVCTDTRYAVRRYLDTDFHVRRVSASPPLDCRVKMLNRFSLEVLAIGSPVCARVCVCARTESVRP
jgi:hypothetical protein